MRNWILILITIFHTAIISAQEVNEISDQQLTRERTAKFLEYSDLFAKVEDSLWFVGKEYIVSDTRSEGSPYFFDELSFNGSLVFNGVKYNNLTLFYDLVKDALILHHASENLGFVFINLNKTWIQEFTLERKGLLYKFYPDVHFKDLDNKFPEGFYEEVYQNDLTLLFKNSKKYSYETTGVYNINRFKYVLAIYLIKEGKVFDVTKKSAFLSVFDKDKKKIKQFMRKSKIYYKTAERQDLVSLIKYCETLL